MELKIFLTLSEDRSMQKMLAMYKIVPDHLVMAPESHAFVCMHTITLNNMNADKDQNIVKTIIDITFSNCMNSVVRSNSARCILVSFLAMFRQKQSIFVQ